MSRTTSGLIWNLFAGIPKRYRIPGKVRARRKQGNRWRPAATNPSRGKPGLNNAEACLHQSQMANPPFRRYADRIKQICNRETRMNMLHALAGGVLAGLLCVSTASAGWAEKTITVIVPAAPGGTTDMAARLVGEKL